MKILVPVDGSDNAKRAVAHGASLAKATGGALVLLHVSEDFPDADRAHAYHSIDVLRKECLEKSDKLLGEMKALVDGQGFQVETVAVFGETAAMIVKSAKQNGCDSIVMGTHGHGLLANILMGSTARKVMAMSDLPVTMIR